MFVLKQKIIGGYRNGEWTFYNKRHRGTDWRASYVNLYAPTDGRIESLPWDRGGGNWINFRDSNGYLHQFAHMDSVRSVGNYKQGDNIGITGNTGAWTTGAHLHHQIKKGLRYYDPETFNFKGGMTMAQYDELKLSIQKSINDISLLYKDSTNQGNRINSLGNDIKDIKIAINEINSKLSVLSNEKPKTDIFTIEEQKGLKQLLVAFQGALEWVRNLWKTIRGK